MREIDKAKIKTIDMFKTMISELVRDGANTNIKAQFITSFGTVIGDIVDGDQDPIDKTTKIPKMFYCAYNYPEYCICLKNVIVKTTSETRTMPDTILFIDQIIGFAFAQGGVTLE